MCFYVVTFLGLCLACKGQTQKYFAASNSTTNVPLLSIEYDESTRAEQDITQLRQNISKPIQAQNSQNESAEHDPSTVTIDYVDVLEVSQNQTANSRDEEGTSDPQEQMTMPSFNMVPLLNAQFVPEFNPISQISDQIRTAENSRLLWHVGIYSKAYAPYIQICGGTFVRENVVISAAHCFWGDVERDVLPAALFAVAAGKRYRPWTDANDILDQKSDIHIPVRYRDVATSYQDDIAIVMLAEEFVINFALQPACINFDEEFDNEQLQEGNMGTVLGWGLTKEDGLPSQILSYLELPAVGTKACLDGAEESFLRYLTSDKICAGVTTGKALCRGDSGGGLVFFDDTGTVRVPYLRGVASTAPRNEHRCNAHALAALTHVRAHRTFLRLHIPGIEEECARYYRSARFWPNKHPPLIKNRFDNSGINDATEAAQPVQFICNCYCNNTKT